MKQTKLGQYMSDKKTVRMIINNKFDNGTLEFIFDYDHYNQLHYWMGDCMRNGLHFSIVSESRRAVLYTI